MTRGWWVPVGGVLLVCASGFALLGFPLDDVWHRLFGQDVTLWGPTHLMLIGGAGLTLIGRSALMVEGEREARSEDGGPPRLIVFQRALLVGGFLVGLSTFQGEFDFGVPQFQLVFQPLLIGLAAGTGLVVARIWAGPGGALIAMAQFVAIRGLLALLVGPGLGEAMPHFPLYAVEAVLVELVALRLGARRPLALAAVSGVLIGTVGIAAEWGWSHVWMPIPWPASLLPEGAILGFGGALAGGLLGALIGAALASDGVRMPARAGTVALAAGLAIFVMVGYGLKTSPLEDATANVSLEDVRAGTDREVAATITIEPPAAAEDAKWLTATAWQGGKLRVDHLEQVGPGSYRTTQPIPAHGDWKSMLRLHAGDSIAAVPIFLPEDPAIPARAVPADDRFTRPFVADKKILQREAKDAPAGIATVAYLAILAVALAFFAALALGLRRLSAAGVANSPPGRSTRPRADAGADRAEQAVPA